jgi:hypothetical protein
MKVALIASRKISSHSNRAELSRNGAKIGRTLDEIKLSANFAMA